MSKMFDMIANSKYATGIDISSHEGDFIITDGAKKALDYVILRAGYVGSADHQPKTDVFFHGYYKELEKHPEIYRGVYWYLSSHTTWEKQYDYYTALIDEKDFDFIALDFETINNVESEAFVLNFQSFMNALEKKYPDKRIFIYTRKDVYDRWITPYTTNMTRFPLWHAKYPYFSWEDYAEPYFLNWWSGVFTNFVYTNLGLPHERFEDEWDLWQTGDVTYIGKEFGLYSPNIDINISKLYRQDFLDWIGLPERLGGITIPPVPPTNGEALLRVTVQDTVTEYVLKEGESINIKVEHKGI